jgi:glycosyltransferase involved in cell wall biosynthesis
MRIDLHVHSKHSRRPAQWFLQKLGCPESFSEPTDIHRLARSRGMSYVTISDHNSIDAAVELAHLPGTFISEEITSYFPEDRCKVHVLALNITEAQHRDIQKARANLFELVAYLNAESIFHILAHPLYAINGKLSVRHVEILLLLFRFLELNGSRSDPQNRFLEQLVKRLTPDLIDTLAERHGIAPVGPEPWIKRLTGGSDDHSCMNIARTWTEVPGAVDLASFLAGLEAGHGRVVGLAASPQSMAHTLYSIAFQYYKHRFHLERHVRRDPLMQFLDGCLSPRPEEHGGLVTRLANRLAYNRLVNGQPHLSESLLALLRRETQRLINEHPEIGAPNDDTHEPGVRERRWFVFVNQISNRVLRHFADQLLGNLSGARLFSLFDCLGSSGGLYTLLAPYFVAYSQFAEDRSLQQAIAGEFAEGILETVDTGEHIAHFSDTFYDINGVALTLQQQVKAALRAGRRLHIVTCAPNQPPLSPGVRNFAPVGSHALPEYPQQQLYYPPLLEILDWCHQAGVTRIVSATPGPMGLAALAIARILRLPISGTYHTQLPQYARRLTGDSFIEELTWRYVLWYYDMLDVIWVPSQDTRQELLSRGLRADKVRLYPRGVDIERFTPAKRNGDLETLFGIRERCVLLYVGRISQEKNLALLANVYAHLSAERTDLHLLVVGDGPYLPELRKRLHGLAATCAGQRDGEELARIYAAADLLVFPSATDTFGNVVMEAQASGLPVVVSDCGGPAENMLPEQTGVVVPADDAQAWLTALRRLVDSPELRRRMGRAARRYMETRRSDCAFDQSWRMLADPAPPMAQSA